MSNDATESYELKISVFNDLVAGLCEQLGHVGLQCGVPSTANAKTVDLFRHVFPKMAELAVIYRDLSGERIRMLDVQPIGDWKAALLMSNRDIIRLVHTWLPSGHDVRLKNVARALASDHETPNTSYREFVKTLAGHHDVGIGPMQQPITYRTLIYRNSLVLKWLVRMLEDGLSRGCVSRSECCNMLRWMLDSSSMKLLNRLLDREKLLPDEFEMRG